MRLLPVLVLCAFAAAAFASSPANAAMYSYVDDKGAYQEVGHWVNTDAHTDRPIMDTCLAALQMMVYYRYLPTFKQVDVPAEVVSDASDKGDIVVDTDL